MTLVDPWTDSLGSSLNSPLDRITRVDVFRREILDATMALERASQLFEGLNAFRLASPEIAPLAPHIRRILSDAVTRVESALSKMEVPE